MGIYIGIVKTTAAFLLSAILLVGVASAVPLPSTPPEVDSTPVSHAEEEPENFREPARLPQEIPEPLSRSNEPPLRPINKTPSRTDRPDKEGEIGTGSILLMGAVIWYGVTVVGITGGRRGAAGRKRRSGDVE